MLNSLAWWLAAHRGTAACGHLLDTVDGALRLNAMGSPLASAAAASGQYNCMSPGCPKNVHLRKIAECAAAHTAHRKRCADGPMRPAAGTSSNAFARTEAEST